MFGEKSCNNVNIKARGGVINDGEYNKGWTYNIEYIPNNNYKLFSSYLILLILIILLLLL